MVEEEAAVSVHESDNGFSVADKEYETLNLHDENEAPSSTDGESGDAKSENNHPRTSLRIWLTSLKRRVMRFSPP